jgi:hypothetical protein
MRSLDFLLTLLLTLAAVAAGSLDIPELTTMLEQHLYSP